MALIACRRLLIPAALLLIAAGSLGAQEYPPVEADIWIELDAVWGDIEPVEFDEARELADAEARFLLSGMIYGYRFSYRPLDRERGVAEEFLLEPVASLPQERVEPVDVRGRGSRLLLLYRYYPTKEEHLRVSSWLSAAIPSVLGYGEERFVLGHAGKMTAYENALKSAVREYARPRIRNKPRRLEGELLLIDTPSVGVQAGKYTAKMRLKIDLTEAEAYRDY